MRLADLLARPEAGMVHLERYCNDGSPSGLTFGEYQVTEAYRPRGGVQRFGLPTVLLPWESVDVSVANPSTALAADVLRPGGVVFSAHPDLALCLPGDPLPAADVMPLASGRTVYQPGAGARHLKLHYAGLLGRVPRELNRARTRASVQMSAELETAVRTPSVAYLAESIGVCVPVDGAEVGMVYREARPRPHRPDGHALIPFFALFSTDAAAPDDPPLLAQLHDGGYDLRHVLALVLDSYAALAFGAGLVPEDHAQNLLLELDPNGRPQRVVRRDLLDWYSDAGVRRDRGLKVNTPRSYDVDDDPGRTFGGRSYAFDFRLGEYILDPLVACAAATRGVDPDATRRWIVDRVHDLAKQHELDLHRYFQPWSSVYRYERNLNIWHAGRPRFVQTEGPVYR